jgi:hypothetical protein
MNKSALSKVRKKAQSSVDNSESIISRFARFMGTTSKGITGDIPSPQKMNKARKFAKNFQGGKSGKVKKLLLGSALILPIVLGGAMKARAASSTDILNQQYGGDEEAMKKDLDAEKKSLDKGKKNVDANVDKNKDALEKQKSELSTKRPEEPQIQPDSEEEPTEEKKKDPFAKKESLDLDAFEEAIDKFVFLSKQGMLFGEKGPGFFERLGNFIKGTVETTKKVASAINNSKAANVVRDVIGSEKDDGYLGPKWLGIKNPFPSKGKQEKEEATIQDGISEVYLSRAQPLQTAMGDDVTPQSETSYDLPPEVAGDEKFMSGISDLSEKYNIPQNDLLAMMDFETGGTFDPATKNMAGSGATGLIQFMPDTAKSLGTSTEELSQMSRSEQLSYVDKYLETNLQGRMGGEKADVSDLYMSVLFPVAVGKPDDFVLFGEGAINEKYEGRYEANKGLDANNDGSITKVEAAAKVINLREMNTKSDVSSVEPSQEMVTAMNLPNQYMDYDDPSGGMGGGQTIVMLPPPPTPSPNVQPNQGGGSSEEIIVLPTSPTEVLSAMQLQSLGAS